MEFAIHALIGLLVVVIWEALGLREAFMRVIRTTQRWRNWKRFFDLQGDVVIATSMIQLAGEKQAARVADVIVANSLREKLAAGANVVGVERTISLPDSNQHCIILGSPRYSMHAREIQRYFELPYEYVYEYAQADPPRLILKIISNHGQEYTASVDARVRLGPGGTDYGFLFLATLPSGKRIYWLSGVHGPGTLGVAKYLLEHPQQFVDAHPSAPTWSQQWLFRVTHDGRTIESLDMVTSVDALSGPLACAPRVIDTPVRAIISDFGNVLMTFDRDRTYRALAHACHRPYNEIARAIDSSECRGQYERGELDDQAFYRRICDILNSQEAFTFEAFAEWWGDIFWENRSVIELFRGLSKELPLVLLSNTNRLHFETVREHYPDVVRLFRGHVLSYEEKRVKPAPELFLKAMAVAGSDIRPEECLYVDDMPEYAEAARRLGMQGCVYYNYPHFVRELRRAGVNVI